MPTSKPITVGVPPGWYHLCDTFTERGHSVVEVDIPGGIDVLLSPQASYWQETYFSNGTLVDAVIARVRKQKTWAPKAQKGRKKGSAVQRKSQSKPLVNLEKLMTAAGHTPQSLSERTGVSDETIRKCYRPDYKPNRPNAMALAGALGCTLEELTGEKEKQ